MFSDCADCRGFLDLAYRVGFSLPELEQYAQSALSAWKQAVNYARKHREDGYGHVYDGVVVDTDLRGAVEMLTFIACLLPDAAAFQTIADLLAPDKSVREFDLLLRAFLPKHPVSARAAKVFKRFSEPLYRILAAPGDEQRLKELKNRLRRQAAVASDPETTWYFAYETALVVCAYDLDDSSLRSSPYYPYELVDHYRAHLRHTRDGWRAPGTGPGVELPPPPPPRKADLARSKRKGIARWVELACDGEVDVVESVLETIGKPRKLDDLGELSCALGEHDQGIHVDIKDDASAAASATDLLFLRCQQDFAAPPPPPEGPARISLILRALDPLLAAGGYTLVSLDNDDDAWHLVTVVQAYEDEFLELSAKLGIKARLARNTDFDE